MADVKEIPVGTDVAKVVGHDGGPLLVLGCPGSGKTHSLEQRFLSLAQEEGLAPHRILLICTNRTYAMGAKDRLVWALPHEATIEVPVYTWHALAYHLVSRYYPLLGYKEPPVLMTAPEQWGFVREMLANEAASDWPQWHERLKDRGFVDEVADFCLRVSQKMMSQPELDGLAQHRPDRAEVASFYPRYRRRLREQSRLDYAGLIESAVELLKQQPDVAAALKRRFPHVLVDDGQEMSHAHREFLGQLETANLVIAADPDSGIETFRGAEPDWVFGFERYFGPHATVVMSSSQRLGQPAFEMSQRLIAMNDDDATHRSANPADHETYAEARQYGSIAEEAEAIARELRWLHLEREVAWDQMAILISQPRVLLIPLERALTRYEVPYAAMSGDRPLASEPSVACFLDLVRVALKVEGWQALLPNLLTSRIVGLSFNERRQMERSAWQSKTSLVDMVEDAESTAEFRRLRELVKSHSQVADECFWQVFNSSTCYASLRVDAAADPTGSPAAELDAVVAFSHALGRFVERRHGKGSMSDYLSEAARADFGSDPWLPTAASDNRVALMSFHSAKGRQWHTVVVAGCLDAWIPKGRRAQGIFDPFVLEIADPADREVEAIADDRRTFYVAGSRAAHRTIFTCSAAQGRGRPTRFLAEMGLDAIQVPEAQQMPALTLAELRSQLRKALISDKIDGPAKIAAVAALAEIPGTDPTRWYGRWDWTEGSVPLYEDGVFNTSYSRLGVFDNCGLQYVLQSVLGLDSASTYSMKFGTWIHALLQAVHEKRINDIPTLKKQYALLFDETIFPNATMAKQFRRDGEKMLQTIWEKDFRQHDVITEYSFNFPYHGANLRGRIDRIDIDGNGLKLTDYKTSKYSMSQPKAQKSLQLAIYYLAARIDPELAAKGIPVLARLVYPGAPWPNGDLKAPSMKPADADAVIDEIPELLKRVMEEDFKPSPDADCFFCDMKPLCPLYPEGKEVQT